MGRPIKNVWFGPPCTFTVTAGHGTVMTITAVLTGTVQTGMVLTQDGLTGGPFIDYFGTFNGTSGTVILSQPASWLAGTVTVGRIVVNGVKFADGTTFSNAYIVKQTGSTAYVVQDSGMTHAPEIVFMVNASAFAALQPGQCWINATPFGGSALPCSKISQFRLSLYNVANATTPYPVGQQIPASLFQNISNYVWSYIPAVANGEATLIP